MDKPDNVRIADENDIPQLFWTLMREQETDWPMGLPASPRQVAATVIRACNREDSCAGIIDGPNGTILGSIAIRAEVPWFSEVTILGGIWLFMDTKVRNGQRLSDDLFRFAEWHREDMSRRVGYDMILENMVLSFTRLPAKIRLWGKYGKQVGAVFWARGATEDVREEFDKDVHDGADRPERDGGLRQPAGEGPESGQPAPANLQRPTRRAAQQLAEPGDLDNPEQRKPSTALFD